MNYCVILAKTMCVSFLIPNCKKKDQNSFRASGTATGERRPLNTDAHAGAHETPDQTHVSEAISGARLGMLLEHVHRYVSDICTRDTVLGYRKAMPAKKKSAPHW
jgi:hypothetical protein